MARCNREDIYRLVFSCFLLWLAANNTVKIENNEGTYGRYRIKILYIDVQILHHDSNWLTRGVRETIFMRVHRHTLNREGTGTGVGEIQSGTELGQVNQVTDHVT